MILSFHHIVTDKSIAKKTKKKLEIYCIWVLTKIYLRKFVKLTYNHKMPQINL